MSGNTHCHDLSPFTHEHHFASAGAGARAAALWQVTGVTLAAMALELAVGYWSGSLALTADGWHMGTHAVALGGAALAMHLSRRAAHSHRFPFGGWKIEMLAAYSSALLMLGVSLSLAWQALQALRAPQPVAYVEAMTVAAIGLAVNLLCAWLLARSAAAAGRDPHTHRHADAHGHADDPIHAHGDHGDHNFHAAWLHVLADALTSVLALLALAGGLWLGWRWLDPAVALVGAVVIARWGIGVGIEAARALVDASRDTRQPSELRARLESDGDAKVADLHVWQVGPRAFAAAVSVVADAPLQPAVYRQRLVELRWLRHLTLEVHRCTRGIDEHALH
jgi:cation diffusion facilitator family transporter